MAKVIEIRKGQAPAPLDRAEFGTRFRASFACFAMCDTRMNSDPKGETQ